MTTAAASIGNSSGGFSSAHGAATASPPAGSMPGRPSPASTASTTESSARGRWWLQLMAQPSGDPPPVPVGWYHQ